MSVVRGDGNVHLRSAAENEAQVRSALELERVLSSQYSHAWVEGPGAGELDFTRRYGAP
jgi:hypothetical protein